jgi:2-polyprenyl-3-methyl-5-hydroxy-6-metoxy-1,4-benzoquinol methylase
MDQSEWDARYGRADHVWSGNPNGALVAEVSNLEPGSALDVGAGEGADAIWLSGRGWRVTALDISPVALAKGREEAEAAGLEIEWLASPLTADALGDRTFDLVTTLYPALPRTPDDDVLHALIDAVGPAGSLLVVHHAHMNLEHAHAHGFDPGDYIQHEDVAAALGDGWEVDVRERRARVVPTGGQGAGHVDDLILRARRR